MAEASKRNWPWKKKIQDKVASSPESIESSPRASPHNSKFFDEQDVSKILSDHARVSDEAMTQWQHSESKLKQLIDKLNAAQTELTTKDVLVKQHAKVAEEAVTGWEKAEAEASAMKKQLDTAIHQKLATEDRVSHLDGALKECMRQLRQVREDQEVRIHETIIKKTREYDKLRQDMEAKLAEAAHHLQDACSEALDARAEAHAMSIILQERTKALEEAMDVKACTETEVKILQAQIQSTEKENSTLNYELHLLSKELEIRNVERDCERRVAENAGKNQLENLKKIAKLEAECQKLRVLVRKKLPGPAALAQMKIEVDVLGCNSSAVDLQKRRSLGRSASTSPKELNNPVKLSQDSFRESYGAGRDTDNLSVRLLEMDDELKLLKEALAKRDEELQASRLICAKTASKLSHVEEQLKASVSLSKKENNDLCFIRQGEVLRKRTEVIDPWNSTSALLAALANADFTKGTDKEIEMGKLDLVDDFTEIERLAMSTEKGDLHNTLDEESEESFGTVAEYLEKKLIAKEAELEDANSICKGVSQQLMVAKEQLSILQSRNGANEATLVKLQEKLDKFCDDNVRDRNITKELEDLVEAQSIAVRAGAANEVVLDDTKGRSQYANEVNISVRRSVSSRSSSEFRYEASEISASVFSDSESKTSTRGPDFLTTVRSLVNAVEALAKVTGLEQELSSFKSGPPNGVGPDGERQACAVMQWKLSGLDHSIDSLIGVSNKLLHGETDMVEFLAQVTAVISYLVRICGRKVVHVEVSREICDDWPDLKETGNESERVSLAKGATEWDTDPDVKHLEAFDDPEAAKGENVEFVGVETAEKRLESMNIPLNGAEEPRSDMFTCHVECELQSSLSNNELDRDMLRLLDKVVVLEEELEDEKRQHQEIVAKYRDFQQNNHR